jgi:C1A family cysteine protease/chitodextrinase
MEKHLDLKKYVNLKKTVFIFSELIILLLVLSSSIVMAETGFPVQNKLKDVQKSSVNQAASSQKPVLAPKNPTFIESQKSSILYQNGPSITGYKTGLITSPVDLRHLGRTSTAKLSRPSYYDLRTLNKVTLIKDQGYAGSCWAFATYASLESYLLPGENRDFSENNMKNLLTSTASEGFDYDEGGDMFMSTAYLARWSGPVAESDDLYNDSSSYSPSGLPVQKHVQNVLFIPGRKGPLDNDLLKQAVQQYGAVFVSLYIADDFYGVYSPTNSTYYYDRHQYDRYPGNANHAVAIVGWNDSFDKHKFTRTPPGNGAFIVKNSWSTDFGDNGYFYVSYYDTFFGADQNAVFTAENSNDYRYIYQYDPLGWCDSIGYGNSAGWGANVFTANSDEVLKAVSFYSTDSNCEYKIYIYTNPVSGPISQAGPVFTQSGTCSNAGYHTANLNSRVQLRAGQKFSVVIKFTTSGYNNRFGYNFPIAIEEPISYYSSKARANVSESFVSPDGNAWTDLTAVVYDSNVCIKAFTDSGSGLPVANFSATPISGNKPQRVAFNDTSTGLPTSWIWSFGDGTGSTIKDPIHVYNKAGKYTVTLKVSNAAGNSTMKKTGYITVTTPRPPVAAFTANRTTGKAPLAITFNDRSTGSPETWYWSFGDGKYSTTNNPLHVYAKPGKYTISLTVTNAAGRNTKTMSNYVKANK